MTTVSLQDLQQNPGTLLDRVAAGESLVVMRDGLPVAELRPWLMPTTSPRPFGLAAGTFTLPDNFDTALPEEVLRSFEGQ